MRSLSDAAEVCVVLTASTTMQLLNCLCFAMTDSIAEWIDLTSSSLLTVDTLDEVSRVRY